MKCPQCVKQGKKSKVYIGMSSRTAAYCPPFYDEDGVYHLHDSNITHTDYRCSNRHGWTEREERTPCPTCGNWWEEASSGNEE